MNKIFTKEIQVAITTVVGLVVLFFGLQFLKGLSLAKGAQYTVVFTNVSGVSQGNPVYLKGFKVGTVREIHYDFNDMSSIAVVFGLDSKLKLPRGSQAEVSKDMMGNVTIEMMMGPDPLDLLHEGDTIEGHQASGLMGAAAGLLPQVEQLLPKLDSILAAVNTLLNDPALSATLQHVEGATRQLNTTSQQLAQLSGELNRQVPSIMQHADGTLANTEQLTQRLAQVDVEGTMSSVQQTLRNVEQVTAALNNREGTVGLLLHDAQLYNNLSSAAYDADMLLQDLKANPKRYVHFSVFGKKNK